MRRTGKITLQDIALASKVSIATASKVLSGRTGKIIVSEPTRRKVLEAAEALGYKPNAAAKALVTGRSQTVLMVSVGAWDANMVERLYGIEDYLSPLGYTVRICTVDLNSGLTAYSEMLHSRQADGVLLAGYATPETYPVVHALKQEADVVGIPVIALADGYPREYVNGVADIDDEGGAQQAVMHLIEHGHRRIAFLGVVEQNWSEKRRLGYLSALCEAGIPGDADLIKLGGKDQKWAFDAAKEVLSTCQFSAMFVVNDEMALAALSALTQAGVKVPDDCALIGFDNIENLCNYVNPPLTTVQNPLYEVGKLSAEMLIKLIEGEPFEHLVLPVHLVIRRSCGCMTT